MFMISYWLKKALNLKEFTGNFWVQFFNKSQLGTRYDIPQNVMNNPQNFIYNV